MSEEETYWREQRCGCRYRVERLLKARFFDRRVVEVEYCDEHHRRWSYLDYLCASPRKREIMAKKFDDEMLAYVRHREEERKG